METVNGAVANLEAGDAVIARFAGDRNGEHYSGTVCGRLALDLWGRLRLGRIVVRRQDGTPGRELLGVDVLESRRVAGLDDGDGGQVIYMLSPRSTP